MRDRLVSPYVQIGPLQAKLRAEARKVGALKNQLRKLKKLVSGPGEVSQ